MYYVYLMVDTENDRRYIGFSSDLKRRIQEHKSAKGSRYTKKGNWELVYYEAYRSKKDALIREGALKDGRAKYHLYKRVKYSLAGQK